MYLDASDHRPRSLLDPAQIAPGTIIAGAAITAGVHLVLPVVVIAVVGLFAAIGISLGEPPPPPPPPIENVVQARFIQLGEVLDPHQLPDRQVPVMRTDTPEPRHAPSVDPSEHRPPPEPHERQRDSVEDMMQRLSQDSQVFAEREEARIREGDPDGVEGGDRTASEGDLYAGRLSAFFRRGWSVPTTISDDDLRGLSTTIEVEIHDDTSLGEWRITRSSGNPDFDESVSAQMTRLTTGGGNVPPPPEELAPQYLGQRRAFRFNGRDAHR